MVNANKVEVHGKYFYSMRLTPKLTRDRKGGLKGEQRGRRNAKDKAFNKGEEGDSSIMPQPFCSLGPPSPKSTPAEACYSFHSGMWSSSYYNSTPHVTAPRIEE